MPIDKKTKELIRKFALKNAIDYGSARESNVLGQVISKSPELKSQMKELNLLILETIKEVNSTDKKKLEKEYEKYTEEFDNAYKEKVEKTSKPSFVLDGAVKGKFATRFPPEPGGYMQLGNAKAAFLDKEFTEVYEGTIALYFDDTNPEKSKQIYVDAFKKDLDWLGITFDREYYASDHLDLEYEYAKKIIENGDSYVCLCDEEKIKELRSEGKECEHRKQKPNANLKIWNEMLADKFKDNEVVLRLKGDMKALNTTLRDPVLFRMVHTAHYRQGKKYFVWPTYDFNTPIVDSIEGLTDVFRSKEYELRDELDYMILDLLKLRKPRIHTFARLEIADNLTSKRKLRELITEGKVIKSWDDPRLVTIAGLRKRGITPEAIKKFVLRFGLSKTNSTVDISMLLDENRKIIDKSAKRLFAVRNPVTLIVDDIPKELTKSKIKVHPTNEMGNREYKLTTKFYIDKSDTKNLKSGSELRLKDLFNVRVKKVEVDRIEATVTGNQNIDAPKIQWVNEGNHMNCEMEIIGPLLHGDKINPKSLVIEKGYVEKYAEQLVEGEVVQFERIGFFKLDKKDHLSFISL